MRQELFVFKRIFGRDASYMPYWAASSVKVHLKMLKYLNALRQSSLHAAPRLLW